MLLLDASTIAKKKSDAVFSLQGAVALRARIPTWAAAPTAIPARARKTLFLARVCLGLDCHEFSTAPSHT
jgi:hypothetical protein